MPKHWTWQCFSGSNARLRSLLPVWSASVTSVVDVLVLFSWLFSSFAAIVQLMYFIVLLYRQDIPSLHTSLIASWHLAGHEALDELHEPLRSTDIGRCQLSASAEYAEYAECSQRDWVDRISCLIMFAYFYQWPIVAVCCIMIHYASTQFVPGYMWPSCSMWTFSLANVVNPMKTTILHCGSPVNTKWKPIAKSFLQHQGCGHETWRNQQTNCVTCRWQLRICILAFLAHLALSILSSQCGNVLCFPYFWLDLIVLFEPVPLFALVESVCNKQLECLTSLTLC